MEGREALLWVSLPNRGARPARPIAEAAVQLAPLLVRRGRACTAISGDIVAIAIDGCKVRKEKCLLQEERKAAWKLPRRRKG